MRLTTLAIGYWILAIGFWLLDFGYSLFAMRRQNSNDSGVRHLVEAPGQAVKQMVAIASDTKIALNTNLHFA